MPSGSIYRKYEESDQETLTVQEADMALGRAGSSLQQCGTGLAGESRSVLALYAVHAMSFVLWAILLAVLVAKSSEMSKELEQLRTDQSLLRGNGSKAAKQLQMLHFNQSAMHSIEAELAIDLKRLQSDQALMKKEVMEDLAKGKSDRDDIRAQAYQILDTIQKGKNSNCSICPANWLLYAGTCYYFSTERKHWSYAKQACTDQGGQLIIIDNEQEQEFLAKNAKGKQYWIGLHDINNEGTFIWVDNNPLSYSNWNRGEPNDYGGGEDCVMMFRDGKWNDMPCAASEEGWICEKKWTC
uniref:C-type lectin domain family 4 member G n=1 Tax=Pelodiscus sinensis TaxID=13735 RepID=K7GJS4_PELSI|nr:C-type lectin domain family 4 member G isoform X1 [Pelodiscus sinensis]|eukprot:XP_006132086.1 C-type lectin domain family 4 member G isoform X1 [Pelodiscus sinensis]